MQVYKLEFGSLLAYCPRGSSEKTEHSRNVMRALKGDKHVENPPIVLSEWIAKKLKQKMTELPFKHFFNLT